MLSDEELRELVEQELRGAIERRLGEGATPDQVVSSLVEEGFVPETARGYVEAATGPAEPDPGRHRMFLSALATCLVMVIVLVAVLAIRT